MTKQTLGIDGPGQAGAGVTPDMIEAGLAIYIERCPDTRTGDVLDREMVKEIFTAMLRNGSQQ